MKPALLAALLALAGCGADGPPEKPVSKSALQVAGVPLIDGVVK
jgi:predicted small lipoprotein YifL